MPLHLSPELLAIIISFLPRFCLPLLSTVSRTWQAAIERHTMRAIHLRSNDLPAFATVFSLGHRRLALAQLDYDAILPSYSDHQCARFETDRDKRLNNEALTAAIHDLFSLLHSWEQEAASSAVVGNKNPDEVRTTPTTIGGKRGATARPISLALDVYSLSDAPYRVGVDVEEQREDVFRGDREDLFECRYQHSFLRLLRADELPLISRISTFETFTDTCEERRIEGASMAGMGAKMPNLETVAWWVDDNEKKYPEVRRMHRFGGFQVFHILTEQETSRFLNNPTSLQSL
ncbi:hypothetical protein MMC31_006715, partial [Peltigera leucophlebia]|nr:hypothetical protein [Peltigera leucophlebia]